MRLLFYLAILLFVFSLESAEKREENGREEEKEEEPPKIGNFALPTSQQPAALFGFGGNIIDAGELQFYCFGDEFLGRGQLITDIIPGLLFGITDNFSVFLNVPFTPVFRSNDAHSCGLEDVFVQFEYAFYNKSNYRYMDQATIVLNGSLPTGSIKKNPPTGFGAPTSFVGGTFYRTFVDWFFFTAHGALLTQARHQTRMGNQYLYQGGFGKNFMSPLGWIYAWIIEIDGQFYEKNRYNNVIDRFSGGNVIYMTPSLWASSERFLFQCGFSFPIIQSFRSEQGKYNFGININIAWSFYDR